MPFLFIPSIRPGSLGSPSRFFLEFPEVGLSHSSLSAQHQPTQVISLLRSDAANSPIWPATVVLSATFAPPPKLTHHLHFLS
jgi:hypothetical protein